MFFLLIILLIFILFVQLTHSMSMGLTLFTQTLIIFMSSGFFNYSFWFSYILFLVFLGGMLVLFIYGASLTSNEILGFSLNTYLTLTLSKLMVCLPFFLSFINLL